MNSYGVTDRGKVRAENQDSFVIEWIESKECLTAVVCDGMGGANAGSLASTLASKSFIFYLDERISASRSKNPDIKRHLNNACRKANDLVYSYSFFSSNYTGMGTTLVGAAMMGNQAFLVNVGDSRGYWLGKKKIVQITKDHSYVQTLIDKGILTPEQAARHPQKNSIMRALGVDEQVECDLFVQKMAKGDRILLCTDGLSNFLTESEILKLAQTYKTPEDLAKNLVKSALNAGANDNVTAVVLAR